MKRIYFLLALVCLSVAAFAEGPDFQDGNLYYKLVNGDCYVCGVVNKGPQKLEIPSTATVQGRTLNVTGILRKIPTGDGSSFLSSSSIYPGVKEIVLPKTITYIGAYAFHSEEIESIVMDGVKTIEEGAFRGCGKLKTVSCKKVEYLGTRCFYNCKSLRKIVIPPSCGLIEESAFWGCENPDFTVIIEDSDRPLKLKSNFRGCQGKRIYIGRNLISWHNGIYEDDLYFFREVDYGDNVTNMYRIYLDTRTVFRWDFDIHHLIIGASIEQVPDFYHDDNNIDSIHMVCTNPPAVRGRFSNRTYLYCKLYVPQGSLNAYKNAPVWKEFFNIEEYESQRITAFRQKAEQAKAEAERKAKLEAERKAKEEAERKAKEEAERKAKETLEIWAKGDIAPHAYEGTKNYKYIDLRYGVGVRKIGSAAFKDCKSVTSITLPSSVTEIGDSAFINCTNLSTIIIPKGVKKIGRHAFTNCISLTSITLSKGLSEIGDAAFNGCNSLTSITIPEGVTEIGWWTFSECTNLVSVTLPNSVREIGDDAFHGCKNLKSITIPNGVAKIQSGAFWGCISLTSITIPNSVTSIGRGAFYRCSSLNSITIPSSVTKIGDDAFKYCTGLTSLTIPSSVTDIGKNVFQGCSNLNLTLPKKLKSKVDTKVCKSVTYYK